MSDKSRAFGELLREHLGAIQGAINPNCCMTLHIRRMDVPEDVGWVITTHPKPDPKEMAEALEKCLELLIPGGVASKDLPEAMASTHAGKHKN